MPDASGNATDAELIAAGQAAGLTGEGLIKAAATVRAEGGAAGARNYTGNTPDTSVDRGFGQFNSFWHPEVTDACADDLNCAMQAIARISNGGTDFSPWAATRTDRFGPLVSHFSALVAAAPAPSSSTPSDGTPPALAGLGSSPLSPAGGGGAPSGGGIGNPFDAVGSAISGGLAPIGSVFTNVRTGFQMAAWRVAFVGLGVLMVGAGVFLFFRAPLEEEAKSKMGAAAGGAS